MTSVITFAYLDIHVPVVILLKLMHTAWQIYCSKENVVFKNEVNNFIVYKIIVINR